MKSFEDLVDIIAVLTAPNGCPWDRVQTHKSIRINMIEEAYEAVDAIDKNDTENLKEELGDVLLQAVLHADIAARNGDFDINAVIERLYDKLVSRHSHIFGEIKAGDENSALNNWNAEKQKEKGGQSINDQLKGLPQAFPSLLRAQKIIKKTGYKAGEITDISAAGLFDYLAKMIEKNLEPEVELNAFLREILEKND